MERKHGMTDPTQQNAAGLRPGAGQGLARTVTVRAVAIDALVPASRAPWRTLPPAAPWQSPTPCTPEPRRVAP